MILVEVYCFIKANFSKLNLAKSQYVTCKLQRAVVLYQLRIENEFFKTANLLKSKIFTGD